MKNLGKIALLLIALHTIMIASAVKATLAQKDEKDGKKAFIFKQTVDKTEVYVGEPVKLSYIFKQRLEVDLSEANFNAPSFANFWAKTTAKVPNRVEDGYNVYQINYLLYPQKSGVLKIESGRMDAGVLVSRKKGYFNFQQAKWKTVYSNPLELQVKALPAGVETYGDYTFTVVADKNVTKTNEPINLTITIQGDGNMDDLDAFKIDVPDATVYADKPLKNRGIFKQKFAIVSDRNFTIPSLDFTFFNGKVQEEHSREFKIEVINNKKGAKVAGKLEKKTPEIQSVTEKVVVYQNDKKSIMITALLAFLAGALTTWLFSRFRQRDKSTSQEPIEAAIKNAKDDKRLLTLLLPFVDKTPKMQELIKQLEENVYGGKSHTIDRKSLVSEFGTYLKIDKREEILDV